jgi:hypothetical protein
MVIHDVSFVAHSSLHPYFVLVYNVYKCCWVRRLYFEHHIFPGCSAFIDQSFVKSADTLPGSYTKKIIYH